MWSLRRRLWRCLNWMSVPPNSYRELKSKKSRLISLSPFLDDDDDDDGDVDRRVKWERKRIRQKKNFPLSWPLSKLCPREKAFHGKKALKWKSFFRKLNGRFGRNVARKDSGETWWGRETIGGSYWLVCGKRKWTLHWSNAVNLKVIGLIEELIKRTDKENWLKERWQRE